MSVGLGPAKGKDFATALGPVLVSPDELPADLDMRAIARVNGEVRTDSRTGAIYHPWERLLETAARNTPGLTPGEIIGSGTVGRGCILEHGDGRWLKPGDETRARDRGHRRPAQPDRLADQWRSCRRSWRRASTA